jgi:hypothetical protein
MFIDLFGEYISTQHIVKLEDSGGGNTIIYHDLLHLGNCKSIITVIHNKSRLEVFEEIQKQIKENKSKGL